MEIEPFAVVFGTAVFALLGAWIYFRRYQLPRVPIGVMNLADIAVMVVAVVALPFLYLVLPIWLVGAFLFLTALSVLHALFQPAFQARWMVWLVALTLLLLDCLTAYRMGTAQNVFFAINDLVLILLTVGISNLWAQSGAKARDMALLGMALAIYDYLATARSPLMTTLIDRLATLPLAPVIAWTSGGARLSIGLGDLLLASVFPLVLRKAYGRTAGLIALALALCLIGVLLAFPSRTGFPVMLVLGPLTAVQYILSRWRRGPERTTKRYLLEETIHSSDKRRMRMRLTVFGRNRQAFPPAKWPVPPGVASPTKAHLGRPIRRHRSHGG